MVNKIISYAVIIFAITIAIGIYINYHIKQPKTFPDELCWKSKYLVRIGDNGSVYTRMKGFVCESNDDIIILEEIK